MSKQENFIIGAMIGLIITSVILAIGLARAFEIIANNEAEDLYFHTMLIELEAKELKEAESVRLSLDYKNERIDMILDGMNGIELLERLDLAEQRLIDEGYLIK